LPEIGFKLIQKKGKTEFVRITLLTGCIDLNLNEKHCFFAAKEPIIN